MQFYISMFWYSFCYLSWSQFQFSLLICTTYLDLTRVSMLSRSCEWTSALLHTQVQRQQYYVKCSKLFMEIKCSFTVFTILGSYTAVTISHRHCGSSCQSHLQGSSNARRLMQSNFYACLWFKNGWKDPDRNISTLKMIQGIGNCSLLTIQKVMKVHVLVARLLMTLNWRKINWTLSGSWLVRFFSMIYGKAVPCNVTMSGSLWRCQINSGYWRQVLGCCSTTTKQNHCKLLPHINFCFWQRM